MAGRVRLSKTSRCFCASSGMSGTLIARPINVGPGSFRERLKVGEIPELPLLHLDLGHVVVEHPSPQQGEPASLGSLNIVSGKDLFMDRLLKGLIQRQSLLLQ